MILALVSVREVEATPLKMKSPYSALLKIRTAGLKKVGMGVSSYIYIFFKTMNDILF